jgi:hypothetical protein
MHSSAQLQHRPSAMLSGLALALFALLLGAGGAAGDKLAIPSWAFGLVNSNSGKRRRSIDASLRLLKHLADHWPMPGLLDPNLLIDLPGNGCPQYSTCANQYCAHMVAYNALLTSPCLQSRSGFGAARSAAGAQPQRCSPAARTSRRERGSMGPIRVRSALFCLAPV